MLPSRSFCFVTVSSVQRRQWQNARSEVCAEVYDSGLEGTPVFCTERQYESQRTIGKGAGSADAQSAAKFLVIYGSTTFCHLLDKGGVRDCITQVIEDRKELLDHWDFQVFLT
jgi:hypothetical protein